MQLTWNCRGYTFTIKKGRRPLIMGILNITPDSFSDGGRFLDTDQAVEHGLAMIRQGADIIDVGGESTRPGAEPVKTEEELSRVIPVIEKLSSTDAMISIDTRRAAVAERALKAGAAVVNDISALTADPDMTEVVRSFGAGTILMHMAGEPRTMQDNPCYQDVVEEISEYLCRRVEELVEAGLDINTLAVDPGIGFGKTTGHNMTIISNIGKIRRCGRPVVLGLSRKRFLGELTGHDVGSRCAAGLGALCYALTQNGVDIARVHDVTETRDALMMIEKLGVEKNR